ncbi:MAG: glycosyltransferase family 4 protein [Promethearchaeota archaeon]
MKKLNILMIGSDKEAFLTKDNLLVKRLLQYSKYDKIYYLNITPGLNINNFKRLNLDITFLNSKNFLINLIKFFISSRKIIKSNRINIISVQDPFLGILGLILNQIFKIPLNIQLHQDLIDNPYWLIESKKNYLLNCIGKIVLKFANSIRVVSNRIKKNLIKHNNLEADKISVCPVYIESFKYLDTNFHQSIFEKFKGKFIILSIGRLIKTKNYDLLINAAKEIKDKNSNVLFLIGGDGPEKRHLEDQIDKLKLHDNVKILGWVSRSELVNLFHICKFFILTSNHEGFGRVFIESLYCGKPIITTNTGIAGDVVINNYNGLVVPINNKTRLVEALQKLIENQKLLKKFEDNAKNFDLSNFDKEKIIKKLRATWEKSINLYFLRNK